MNNNHSIQVIGLVGGVGSGKSTVAEIFQSLGCHVIDADATGHEVLSLPQVRDSLCGIFGSDILGPDGDISRPALARKVFGQRDEQQLKKLESIVHPLMFEKFHAAIADAEKSGAKAVILDAAVLFEARWNVLCTGVIFVEAPDAARRERVQKNRGWDENKWQMREKSQFSLDKKASQCCYKLCNDSDIPHLKLQVKSLLDQITGK